jgi:prepilin-type N-terminal cleavage/methylation domain-containing protein
MSRHAGGFTLVEMLVALALAALVGTLLLHGVRLAATALDRHGRRAERLDDRRAMADLLRRTLSAAVAGGFDGQADSLHCLSIVEDAGAGLYRIDIAREGNHVTLRRRLAQPATDLAADPLGAAAVLSGVAVFRLAYFGAASGAEPVWQSAWKALAGLPRLVRVSLDLAGQPPRPPLVVTLWNAAP